MPLLSKLLSNTWWIAAVSYSKPENTQQNCPHTLSLTKTKLKAVRHEISRQAVTLFVCSLMPGGEKAEKKQAAPSQEDVKVDVSRLDLRIGRIITAEKHPDADSLYVEQVDVGEASPRTVVSGLVKHIPLDQVQWWPFRYDYKKLDLELGVLASSQEKQSMCCKDASWFTDLVCIHWIKKKSSSLDIPYCTVCL